MGYCYPIYQKGEGGCQESLSDISRWATTHQTMMFAKVVIVENDLWQSKAKSLFILTHM